jgi:peptidoglycan hydrolase CwlO-like protein
LTIKIDYTKIYIGDNMKKLVLFLLLIISISSLVLAGIKVVEYNDIKTGTTEDEISLIENEIKEVEEEITEKEKELNNIKESKKEELEEIDKWQKMVDQIKSYM